MSVVTEHGQNVKSADDNQDSSLDTDLENMLSKDDEGLGKNEGLNQHDQMEAQKEDDTDETEDEKTKTPYSILSHREKLCLAILLSMVGVWSSIAAPIYYPALTTLEKYFDKDEEIMNLSVVAYLILQGIMPTFTSNLADTIGRRPTIMICLLVYIGADAGLARTDVFWLLIFLRCVQAGGIAPVIAISSGVVGDFTERHERGAYIGTVSGVTLIGQGFGALIGAGIMSGFHSWRAIFWFLAIGAGVALMIIFLLFPETKRSMSGNLSVTPKRFINRAPILGLPFFKKKLTQQTESLAPRIKSFDILSPFKILIVPEVFLTLIPVSIQYTAWTMSLTSLSLNLSKDYGYSVMKVGYCYLPTGIGCLVGSITSGRVLDWYYKKSKAKYNKTYEQLEENERPKFNIFKARLDVCYIPSFVSSCALVVFGWCIDKRVNVAVILIASTFVSFCSTYYLTSGSTILVDLFPGKSSTSSSCINFTRCLFAAGGIAALSKMTAAMTVGGCYTFMGCLTLSSNLMIYSVMKRISRKLKNNQPIIS